MLALVAVLVAMLASGCASLQQSGSITSVPEDSAGTLQMQIWPSPPSPGEAPTNIVSGFLEAARSGASNQGIASDYLTGEAHSDWQSEQKKVIVLADYSESYPLSADSAASDNPEEPSGALSDQGSTASDCTAGSVSVTVSGNLVGRLDPFGLYTAESGAPTYTFQVSQTKAGCRISSLPSGFGVLMERSDFESSYSRHTVYYQSGNYAQTGDLVPAQVYLPSVDADLTVAQDLVQLIIRGVPSGLGPALADPVTDAVFKSVVLDSSGTATVTIDGKGACTQKTSDCQGLANQFAYTLYSLSTKVSTLNLDDVSSGHTLTADAPTSGSNGYGLNARDSSGQGVGTFFAIADDGTVKEVHASGSTTTIDPLAIGPAKTQFKAISVEPGTAADPRKTNFALVGHDGSTVYVTRELGGTYPLTQVYPTSGTPIAGSVQQMSWDTAGDLWFTVKINGVVSIYRYGGGELNQVAVTGLGDGGQIVQVAAAPDGERVAVGISNADGYSIAITAASSSNGSYQLNLSNPEIAASSWNSISDFDWYNEETLAVLGIQSSSQSLGLYQVYADGSAVYDSLTEQPVQASPPSDTTQFVWNATGQPIAQAAVGKQNLLYELSVEGETAQPLSNLTGTWPSY